MSYTVLARKWRPQNFAQLVGQEHVQRAIVNAIEQQRVHHAYLFTGTRGVGKTTIARIFSKCLNCETGITATPCGTCNTCQEIEQGRFVDLMEIDAASRTKVEDTREILDNVQYRPSRGRYKVYLIDEVHMLSNSSFNALLKTLEEPPPHVIFLLATTDPQKLPVTVLSRCLQFHLKRMTLERINQHLADVLSKESIEFDDVSLNAIAKAADGSMRDALSLLDQAIAFGGGKLSASEVIEMLGSVDHHFVRDLVMALAENDPQKLMNIVDSMAEFSPNYAQVLSDILSQLHQLAVANLIGDSEDEVTRQLLEMLSAEDIQLYYQIGLHAKKDLPLAPEPREGFEMALLRMLAFRPQSKSNVIIQQKKNNKVNRLSSSTPKVTNTAIEESSPADLAEIKDAVGVTKSTDVTKSSKVVKEAVKVADNDPLVDNDSLVDNDPIVDNGSIKDAVNKPTQLTPSNNSKQNEQTPVIEVQGQVDNPPFTMPYQEISDNSGNPKNLNNSERVVQSLVNQNLVDQNLADQTSDLHSVKESEPADYSSDQTEASSETASNDSREVSVHERLSNIETAVQPSTAQQSVALNSEQQLIESSAILEDTPAASLAEAEASSPEKESFEVPKLIELSEPDIWYQVVNRVGITGAFFQILNNSRVDAVNDDTLNVTTESSVQHFVSDQAQEKITSTLSEFFNQKIRVIYQFDENLNNTPKLIAEQRLMQKLADVRQSYIENPKVANILSTFEAQILEQDIVLNEQ
ncbi:MAG: DNA polymerase III subunit gamma/tau [Gammaproteobacteria bacterium]|nr:DNA polymerase III subunit gamma/tau [Gammaproteobacteria bacterium]